MCSDWRGSYADAYTFSGLAGDTSFPTTRARIVPMRRTFLLAAVFLLAAAPAAAQGTIRPGQRVTGELAASDPRLDDGSHFDVWRFQGEANHRYRVTLRSDDFDAFLTVGSTAAPGCDDCATDDDSGGGTDAQVEFTGSVDGTYEIRANSFGAGETGPYALTLVDEGIVEADKFAMEPGAAIGLDEPVSGALTRSDAKMDGHSYSARTPTTAVRARPSPSCCARRTSTPS